MRTLLFLALALLSPRALAGSPLSVNSPLGTYAGRELRGSRLFPNIAYAKPPVGKRRWRRPESETAARQLDSPVECPQVVDDSLPANSTPLPRSEDCLYLNVWAPKEEAGKAPVVFLVHGGGLLSGSGLKDFYDGSVFARRGIVFVSFNYRLAELGYGPRLEEEPGSLGLMDQSQALDWVVRNISAFGGDPDRIFLMGHSKGAESVTALVESGLGGPWVKGAIAFSAPRHFEPRERVPVLKFWPGEQGEAWQSILKKRGFYLYVPQLPGYQGGVMLAKPYRLLATSLYDESFSGQDSPMYCVVLHHLESFPAFINAHNYVLHSPDREHGAEILAIFREEPFGKTLLAWIKDFVDSGEAPGGSLQAAGPPWREQRRLTHVFRRLSYVEKFALPQRRPKEGQINALHRLCGEPPNQHSRSGGLGAWLHPYLK